MKKGQISTLFRSHAREHLSPKEHERSFVASVYASIQDLLGASNCLQVGSYARFTATTPMHDLDIIYVLGDWDSDSTDPSRALAELHERIRGEYVNPTTHKLSTAPQSHSVSITFTNGDEEVFSVDIVPAFVSGKNSFGEDMYMVPEILNRGSHRAKLKRYEVLAAEGGEMTWIKSDPRGWIEVAKRVNQDNDDFRKAVKFVKGWRSSCKKILGEFKLKSFHVEQAITRHFKQNPNAEMFDAVFAFFCELPVLLQGPQFVDRADASKYIDEYVDRLSSSEKELILQARDAFLIKLEDISSSVVLSELLAGSLHIRASEVEAYLFDESIPVLIEDDSWVDIRARIFPEKGGFIGGFLDDHGIINIGRHIEFRAEVIGAHDLLKWKVKNDNSSKEPRGEITDHTTLGDPENTRYEGKHCVYCYVIRDGVCIAKDRQLVVLKEAFPGSITTKM